MKIPCFILVRKNSKGLINKNKKKIGNKTLVQHAILYAKKSKFITDIVVSTDDISINKLAKKNGCLTIFPRPKKFSHDRARTEPALLHAAQEFIKINGKFDIYTYMQATEPFRPKKILDACINSLLSDKSLDSAFAGYAMHKNFWYKNISKYKTLTNKKFSNLPRQIKPTIFREDTGIALASRFKILKKGNRIGKNVTIHAYEGIYGLIDIHEQNDLKLANLIYKNFKNI
tara:strand:+ start:1998 stop:2687 length:690 start_codon:yes stop_codon:yes gene_type:complete